MPLQWALDERLSSFPCRTVAGHVEVKQLSALDFGHRRPIRGREKPLPDLARWVTPSDKV
jgi:hypothetical protein